MEDAETDSRRPTGPFTSETLPTPLRVGELVILSDGKTGHITRAYPRDDKYAVKESGALIEIKGQNNSFQYFRHRDLIPATAPTSNDEVAEPPAKQAKVEPEPPPVEASNRLQGKVSWFSKEKGFGKIKPTSAKESGEDVFLHQSQVDGGPEGPHAQAISEGVVVTYELTTHWDGRACACHIQVESIARAMAAIDPKVTQAERSERIRRVLLHGLKTGTFQVRGAGKPSMEDRFIVRSGVPVESLGGVQKGVCALFGVFDGHSGASCSDFIATNLDRTLFDCLRHQSKQGADNSDKALRSALLATFRMSEHNYFQYLNKLEGGAAHAWATAGSTACTAVFFGPDEDGHMKLVTANAGDSRVVLGKKDGRVVRLSEDHTPNLPSERKRIEQEGAMVVNASGIWRIVLPSKRGTGLAGLSVSRGFGDLEYKQPAGVVSAVPDVTVRTIDLREDSFVAFASDGVWGPVSDLDCVQIVSAGLREGGDEPAQTAAQRLTEEAHRRDGHDDKTAVVVWFGDLPTATAAVVSGSGAAVAAAGARNLQPRSAPTAAKAGAGADDMFASGHPSKVGSPAKSGAQKDTDLDDLFASFARDVGAKDAQQDGAAGSHAALQLEKLRRMVYRS